MNLSTQQITKIGLALGVCAAAYKFVSNPLVKTAAIAVAAVVVAKNAPLTGPALS